jgi:NAD(P)-dependent dehydrogenase (short-subunit alcohol dehydrogenase family)
MSVGTGRLAGKVAVITGTAGGQGRAAALLFAREGAQIVGCDVGPGFYAPEEPEDVPVRYQRWTAKDQDETVTLVREAGGEMVSMSADLTSEEDAKSLIALALSTYGQVDVLYNNAAKAEWGSFAEISHETFWNCMRQEVDTVFNPTKAVWPHMSARRTGSIINAASMSATKVFPGIAGVAHMSAKSAVLGLTRHLAYEGSLVGIRVNALSPGLVVSPTSIHRLNDEPWINEMLAGHMIQRLGTPDDIAAAALFLASDESSWVTAANIPVDGGATGL